MQTIYDIDYTLKAIELLPPDKRWPRQLAWLRTLLKPIQFLRDKYLGQYRTGSNYPEWVYMAQINNNPGYSQGAIVTHNQVLYQSLADGNFSTPPSALWQVYLPSFIGTDERVKFNGQKLVLEYALNKRFHTAYRQPPLTSDIYIETVPYSVVGLRVGQTTGSHIGRTTSSDTVGYPYPFVNLNNFIVHMPATVYHHYGEAAVRLYADAIVPAGLKYTIQTYF
jgi:hypothetical protein